MKTPVLYRFVLMTFLMAFSLTGFANRKANLLENVDGFANASLSEQPPQDDKKPEVERKRPDVKEVPKSRRMPKPKAVVDRVKQTRPPVKVVRPGVLKRN